MPAHALFSSHHVARAFKSLLPLSAEGFPLSSPQVSCLHTSSPALKACSQVLKFCLVSVFCCLLLGVFVLELSYLTQKLSWDQARIKCFFDNTALGHGGSKALRDSKRSLSGSIFHRVASKFRGDGCHANDLQASKWLYMVKSDFQMYAPSCDERRLKFYPHPRLQSTCDDDPDRANRSQPRQLKITNFSHCPPLAMRLPLSLCFIAGPSGHRSLQSIPLLSLSASTGANTVPDGPRHAWETPETDSTWVKYGIDDPAGEVSVTAFILRVATGLWMHSAVDIYSKAGRHAAAGSVRDHGIQFKTKTTRI
ncbi:hypothetical protein K438DRAFT_1936970 [Mycena galopus ATCC 62051]|nr:hypothetical protein K438DRAFT_1936970 [Mycena galopus ATCC 62051]